MTIDVSVMTEQQQQVLENEGVTIVGAADGDSKAGSTEYKKDDGAEST